jgi:hypothetical protein
MRDVEFGRRRALGSGGAGLGSDFAIGALEGDAQIVDDQRLWENKYAFRREMLPSFVNVNFGRKVRVDPWL